MLQTGVSSDGTTLNILALAGVSARETVVVAPLATLKSGALSPGLSCGPASVIGVPLNVRAALRFCMASPRVLMTEGGLWARAPGTVYGARGATRWRARRATRGRAGVGR